jgi:hypothetical protein
MRCRESLLLLSEVDTPRCAVHETATRHDTTWDCAEPATPRAARDSLAAVAKQHG